MFRLNIFPIILLVWISYKYILLLSWNNICAYWAQFKYLDAIYGPASFHNLIAYANVT